MFESFKYPTIPLFGSPPTQDKILFHTCLLFSLLVLVLSLDLLLDLDLGKQLWLASSSSESPGKKQIFYLHSAPKYLEFCLQVHLLWNSWNKTGLQPVSRPLEQIVGFYHKNLKKVQKNGANLKVKWTNGTFGTAKLVTKPLETG